jgi:hypothetical protein
MLAPAAVSSRLFERCLQLNFGRAQTIRVPRVAAPPPPPFVDETMPSPVVELDFAGTVVGPLSTIPIISAVTSEVESAGPEVASAVIGRTLAVAIGKALDAAVFHVAPADTLRPGGLLNGLTAFTAATGGGLTAVAADLGALAGAIADAGIDGDDLVFVAHPRTAIQLRLLAGPAFSSEIPFWGVGGHSGNSPLVSASKLIEPLTPPDDPVRCLRAGLGARAGSRPCAAV